MYIHSLLETCHHKNKKFRKVFWPEEYWSYFIIFIIHDFYFCFSQFWLLKQSTTEIHKPRKFISHTSGGWKPEIRVPGRSGSGESPLPGGRQTTSCCILTLIRKRDSGFSIPLWEHQSSHGSSSRTSSKSNYLPKTPPLKTITLGIGLQHMGVGGDTDIQPISTSHCTFYLLLIRKI